MDRCRDLSRLRIFGRCISRALRPAGRSTAAGDQSVKRNGIREDIAPTVLKRFGVDQAKLDPKLDGIPLDEPAPECKAPAEDPNPRPAGKQEPSRG
jgi:hypothetical protein